MKCIHKLWNKIFVYKSKKNKSNESLEVSVYNDCSTELLAVAEKQYYYELDQQNKENNYISIPIGVLTILLSAAKFPLDNKINYSSSVYSYLFYFTYGIFCCIVPVIIYYMYKHQNGITYARIQPVNAINDKVSRSLKDYFDSETMKIWISEYNPSEEQLKQIKEAEVNIFLVKEYNLCAQTNYDNNSKKNFYYSRIKILLLFAILFIVSSYVFHYFLIKQNNNTNNHSSQININLVQIIK